MRRLAKKDREDRVRSRRDYQTIDERHGILVELNTANEATLVFRADVADPEHFGLAVGGYLQSGNVGEIIARFSLVGGDNTSEVRVPSQDNWCRWGVVLPSEIGGNRSIDGCIRLMMAE